MDDAARITKNRACVECKKHKVKCDKKPGDFACARCRKHNYKCASNNPFQRFFEDDLSWKRTATAKTAQLQAAVDELLRHNGFQHLSNYGSSVSQLSPPLDPIISTYPYPETTALSVTLETSPEPEIEPELASSPINNFFEVTKPPDTQSEHSAPTTADPLGDDLISRGILSLKEAEYLFTFFNRKVNHYLCGGIALVHSDLASVRPSSCLLLTVILTVAALHIPGKSDVFDICYSAFISALSNSTFDRCHTLDDIRGLIIGAFWLPDLNWMLSSHAVRIATEMGLHHSLRKLYHGKPNQFERTQLWYLLYICDHHFSIGYNRPPLTCESEGIMNYEAFLRHPSARLGDVRLIAQVTLFLSLTKAYHRFGSDLEEPLEEPDLHALRGLNLEIETWRMKWEPKSEDNMYVGAYPSKSIILHYYFARFQLNSLALRAITSDISLSTDRRESANIAVSSAIATLNMVLHEPDIRAALVGVPLFTHTMIAVSAIFLLKTAWKWNSVLSIDRRQILTLVQNVIDIVSGVKASDKHPIYHITSGLKKMLTKLWSRENRIPAQANNTANGIAVIENEDLLQALSGSFETFEPKYLETWNEFPTSLDSFPILLS
ncbi:hypothetical protein F5884DRAFT_702470 [Xylogone sp. PMI_703]|nr:hypothetical protein F5884DRAFT_702470 [Xylogone sp. PMI_703]